jgi:hypothetical protein
MLFRRTNRPRRSLRPDQHFTLPARWKARPRLETLDERVVPAFLDPANYAVGTYPNAVVTGDFNNDAVQDLAFANWGDQTVSVLLGNPDGTFDPAMSSPAGNAPTSLAAGDFNEDGWLDLVTGDPGYNNNFSDVTVLLGQGNGSFQAPVGLEVSADYYFGAESVSVGDFNGDGNLDIAAGTNVAWSSYYGGGVYGVAAVLLGTGTGAFSLSNWSYTGDGYNTAAAVADFNSDGNLDIASVTDYGYIFVSLGTGTGSFNYWDYYYNQGATPFAVAAADLNNDGTLDLVTANNYSDTASVLLGNGNGTFGSPQLFTAGSSPSSVATADFNGDDALDLITTDSYSGTVSVLLGTGDGSLKPPVNAVVGSTPWGVAVGDFNGDGRMDAASANNSSHNVSVLFNDGTWPALNSPSLSINDVTVTEGNTGTVNATFTVSLSAASSQAVTVHYATVDGSATTAGGDYQATSGTLTFAPGETTKTINVPVNGDRVVEFAEFFSLVLTNPSNSFVADARGSGTITDDEPRASIDYGPVYVTEGNTGTTNAEFTVRLSSAYDQPVDVNYATADAGATAGSDYQAVNSTVTFAPGETVKTISVPIFGDRVAEYSEGFYVNLVGASGYAYGVIQDDEPRISINSVSVNEGNRGTTVMTFTVTLSAAYDQAVTVNFATHDYTATAGQDYEATTGTLTFAAGETSKTISVLIKGDKRKEGTESFYILLSDASENAAISNAYGWGTILDNDNGHGKGPGR